MQSLPASSLPTTPVRRSISALLPELDHLQIREGDLHALTTQLAEEEFPLPEWRAPVFPDETAPNVSNDDVLDFLFVGNTINFQFRDYETGEKFAAEYAGTEWEGAFGMWGCLKREFDENPSILAGNTLSSLSKGDVERLFAPSNGIEMPMLNERHEILTQVGERLVADYEGRFSNLIDTARPRLFADGEGLVDQLVTDFPFRDSSTVTLSGGRSHEIHFWKRAQLAPGMAYGRFHDSDAFRLEDPLDFTIFVDYNLPNVLRGLGILEYSDHLAGLIDSRTMLDAGRREEVEIRAATVAVADALLERLNERRDSPIYAPHLDYKLFSMRDEVSTPIHMTRTTAY
jgi:hypothetical protein